MDANSISIEHLKSEFKSRISYVHLVSSLIPDALANPSVKALIHHTGSWVDTAKEKEIREKAAAVIALLDKAVDSAQKQFPTKKHWQEIAVDHWTRCAKGEFSLSDGIPYGWLAERFECSCLKIPDDMPYHAHIGIGHHAGNAAIE